MNNTLRTALIALGLVPGLALADAEEARIERLEAQNAELSERIEALAEALESGQVGQAGPSGLLHAGSGGVMVGGYGSMKYENLESRKQMDFHRFVIYFGKQFTDRIRFESELELEHSIAGDGKPGAIELEQAYLAFDLNADAEALAFTGRVKWTGMPGVELAATVQRQNDITQGNDPTAGAATFWTAHAIVQRGPFGVRALAAEWRLEGSGPRAVGADRQRGWYVEPAFKPNEKVGLFVRYETWNNRAGARGADDVRQGNLGVNYWPHPDVVFKAEYRNRTGSDEDGFLLGLGYRL